MNSFISGKFLTSRMFIALSLLAFAIYLFSLVVLKKQTGIHLEEIAELDTLKIEVSKKPEQLESLFQKIDFEPSSYSRSVKSSELEYKIVDNKIINDPEYGMFVWIKYKTWLDLLQADLPKSKMKEQVKKEQLLSLINSSLEQREQKALLIDQLRFKFYSDLVHKNEARVETILEAQRLVGPMAALNPKISVAFLEDIVNISEELQAQNLLKDNSSFVSKQELRLYKIFQFLLQVDPVIDFTAEAGLEWFENSSLYCAYYYDHYKLYRFMIPLDQKIGFSVDSTKENFYEAVSAHAKACNKSLKFENAKSWEVALEEEFKLSKPGGPWDLNAKYKNQNKILELLRLELNSRIRLQN